MNTNSIIRRLNARYRYDEEQLYNQFNRVSSTSMFELPKNILIIGTGGIGSNLAYYIANSYNNYNIFLVDPDRVEIHNLPRTIFRYQDIDEYKVKAIADIIAEKNLYCSVYPIPSLFNQEVIVLLNELVDSNSLLIFDCRDDEYNDEELFKSIDVNYNKFRAAYNKWSITVKLNQKYHRPVYGARGYEIINSNAVPSHFVSLLVLLGAAYTLQGASYNSNDVEDLVITFDCTKMFEDLSYISKVKELTNVHGGSVYKLSRRLEEALSGVGHNVVYKVLQDLANKNFDNILSTIEELKQENNSNEDQSDQESS